MLFAVYYPGLSGGFVFDDNSNILSLPGISMQELTWEQLKRAAWSMDGRPISRATFGLNHLFTGFDPYYFKLVNLIIHLINSLLILCIIHALVEILFLQKVIKSNPQAWNSSTIALVVTLAWAVHPVNLTSVLYSVQRMNSLSALFVLSGMLIYIHGRKQLNTKPFFSFFLMLVAMLVFTPLSWYSKENGAILPIFLLITELTIFRFAADSKLKERSLYFFYLIVLFIPGLLVLLYIFQHPELVTTGYNNRIFSLTERLLTESRIVWSYIYMILVPFPSAFGLFQDDVIVSKGIIQPYTTLLSITGIFGLIAIAILFIRKIPYLSFGILIFLSGHLIESTFMPLELKYEHRNYLPSIGIIFPLFFVLLTAGKSKNNYQIGMVTALMLILIYSAVTNIRARDWSDNNRLYLTEALYHPNSPRANYAAGKYYAQLIEQGLDKRGEYYRMAVYHFSKETALRNNSTSGLFGIILASMDSGIEIKQEWVKELNYRLRTYPLEQVNLLWLERLTYCVISDVCDDQQLTLGQLINSALANKSASDSSVAKLYSIRTNYDYRVKGNVEDALESARNAYRYMRINLVYKLKIAQYLILLNRYDDANKTLLEVRYRDDNDFYTKERELLENALKKAQIQNKTQTFE